MEKSDKQLSNWVFKLQSTRNVHTETNFARFGARFLALEQTAGGRGVRGMGGGNTVLHFYRDKKYSFTVLPGEKTVLQYYFLFTIRFLKIPKLYFRYFLILFE